MAREKKQVGAESAAVDIIDTVEATCLHELDSYSDPLDPKQSYGGVIAILMYIFLVCYIGFYIYEVLSPHHVLDTLTSIQAFPTNAFDAYTLPPMNCIAPSGCYVMEQAEAETECYFYAQGEALAEERRSIYYSNDPFNFFQVLSIDHFENFALSFDVSTVKQFTNPLQSETVHAAEDLLTAVIPAPYKLFRGVSTFSFIQTIGLQAEDEVRTWLSATYTETSQWNGNGGCCGRDVYDSTGALKYSGTDDANNPLTIANCNNNYNGLADNRYWYTYISSFFNL